MSLCRARNSLSRPTSARAFIVPSDDVVASTKNGKQILNTTDKGRAVAAKRAEGDHVAVVGENRKLLVFPISELPEMKRGQGVALQKYKGSHLSDVKVFFLKSGLEWQSGDRTRLETNMKPWLGHRASAGTLPPTGFPRTNKFD